MEHDNDKELWNRIIDRYTTCELCDLLDLPIEVFLDAFWEVIIDNSLVLEEIGYLPDD